MRTERECEDFKAGATRSTTAKCKCLGQDPDCDCRKRLMLLNNAYEACVPKDFWDTAASDVTHNVDPFNGVVLPYCEKIHTARRRGYGLTLLGDNGVGKTMFLSYVLMSATRRGYTAYYTTLPRLDYDLKRAMNDREIRKRLDWMLTSDFLAVDEMGKEKFKAGDSYVRMQIERILKDRFDNSMPTLIATNTDLDGVATLYGETIRSILIGKYQVVMMEPGDFRERLRDKMVREMGDGDKAR